MKYLGTKRHHEKWLARTEDYEVAGCFSLTELGHGSNVSNFLCASPCMLTSALRGAIVFYEVQVRGIETIATYDSATQEFIITTPCETAQKYWIGGAAMVSILDDFVNSTHKCSS